VRKPVLENTGPTMLGFRKRRCGTYKAVMNNIALIYSIEVNNPLVATEALVICHFISPSVHYLTETGVVK